MNPRLRQGTLRKAAAGAAADRPLGGRRRALHRATVRRVTAEPLPRANPPAGIVRTIAGDAAAEALALALAVPFLFLHATYQPTVSLGLGSTSVDVTLADAAIACVLVAGVLRARREGWEPLLRARVVLGLAAGFLLVCVVSLATPALLGEDYDLTRHAVSLAKFGWYATLLPATVLLVRSAVDAVPLVRALVAWSVAATSWGLLQFLGVVAEFEGKRPGQREPSFVGIHDLAALSGAALVVGAVGVALGDAGREARRHGFRAGGGGPSRRSSRAPRRRPLRGDDRCARPLARARRSATSERARAAPSALAACSSSSGVTLLVTAGTATMRADTIERFAEFIGIRERVGTRGSRATRTGRSSHTSAGESGSTGR